MEDDINYHRLEVLRIAKDLAMEEYLTHASNPPTTRVPYPTPEIILDRAHRLMDILA